MMKHVEEFDFTPFKEMRERTLSSEWAEMTMGIVLLGLTLWAIVLLLSLGTPPMNV